MTSHRERARLLIGTLDNLEAIETAFREVEAQAYDKVIALMESSEDGDWDFLLFKIRALKETV